METFPTTTFIKNTTMAFERRLTNLTLIDITKTISTFQSNTFTFFYDIKFNNYDTQESQIVSYFILEHKILSQPQLQQQLILLLRIYLAFSYLLFYPILLKK